MANLAVPPVLPAKGLGAAGVLYGLDNLNPSIANAIRVDATGALVVTTVGGAVPAGAAKTTTTAYYTATAPGPGFATGDILRETQIVDPATGAVTSTLWTNMDTGATLTTPPNMGSLAFQPNEPLTNTELRAAPLQVFDTPVYTELVTMNTKFDTLLGNTDQIETIQTQTNALITNLTTYNDGVETLLDSINGNVDGLENLVSLLNTYNDELEPLLRQISLQLPVSLGPKIGLESLSVTLAADQIMPLPTGAATEAKQDEQIVQMTTLIAGVGKDETLEEIRDKVATEFTLYQLMDKVATEVSMVNLLTRIPPALGPSTIQDAMPVWIANASSIGGGGGAGGSGPNVLPFVATTNDTANNPPQYLAGDIIQNYQVIDTTTSPATVTDAGWYNLRTEAFILQPPSTDVTMAAGGTTGALTDSELRAAPVEVFVVNQPAPGPALTPNNQYTETLVAITGDTSAPVQYSAGDTITYTAVYDDTTTPPTLITQNYFNETTGLPLTQNPVPGTIAVVADSGLTNAELRAAAIHVIVDNEQLPGGPLTPNEAVSETLVAIADDTSAPIEYTAGDTITYNAVYNNATTPPTLIGATYFNETTGLPLTQPPEPTTIAVQPATALTDAELRAAPVEVFVVNQVAPGGSVTNNVSYAETLTALAPDTANPSQWSTGDTITYNSVYDNSTTPPTLVSETWFNETTGLPITNPVAPADVAVAPVGGLTDAELRASAVHVIVDNQLAPTAPVTTNSQYIETYTTTTAGTGYSPGDTLVRDVVLDESVTPPTVISETWFNETTNTYLPTPPLPADIAYAATGGLTNAELRATPVDVFVVNQVAPGGSITTNTSYTETVTALTTDTTAPIEWTAGDTITYNAVYDESVTPPVLVSETWINETTGLPITNPPAPADTVAQAPANGLTDAELRAAPVEVFVVNQPSPAGSVTDQVSYAETLVATATDTTVPVEWTVGDTITYNAVYNEATTPPTLVSETWFNETTGLPINGTPPAATQVATAPTNGLTNAELRAESVHVTVDNFPAANPVPSPTGLQFFSDSFIATANDASVPLEFTKGDYLSREIVYDSATATTVSTTWKNLSTGLTMVQAPAGTEIAQTSAASLSNDELRAAPVEVFVVNQNAPVPSATTVQLFSDNFIATANDATAPLEYVAGDYLVREVKFDTVTGTITSTVWKNLSSGATLTQVPSGTTIAQSPANGLTDAELRAAAIHVIVDNPAPTIPAVTTYTTESFTYVALANDATAPLEFSKDDILQNVQTINSAVSPVVVLSSVWTNLTTGLTMTQVPSATAISLQPTSGLTNAELRATPVEVFVVNQTTPTTYTPQQVVSELYLAITAGTGYSVDDVIRRTVVMDTSVTPPTQSSETWVNVTTGATIAAPVATHIALTPTSDSLTDTQLRATPVVVDVVVKPVITRNVSIDRISNAIITAAAGSKELSFAVEAGFALIQGAYMPAGYSVAFTASSPGEVLGAVTVDATNGTVLVTVIE